MIIRWRSNSGYGDFIDCITYSHSCTVKFDTPVQCYVYWPFAEDYKVSPQDPETVFERFQYIASTMAPPKHPVTFTHRFNCRTKFRYINNLEFDHPLHGVWYHNQEQKKLKKVVIWTSRYNVSSVSIEKDPCIHEWDQVIDKFESEGFEVVELTYRTPIKEAFAHINECSFGVGYDGMVHQLFKYLWKPAAIVCSRRNLMRMHVPQSIHFYNIKDLLKTSNNDLLEKARIRSDMIKERHQEYLNDCYDYTKHELFNIGWNNNNIPLPNFEAEWGGE